MVFFYRENLKTYNPGKSGTGEYNFMVKKENYFNPADNSDFIRSLKNKLEKNFSLKEKYPGNTGTALLILDMQNYFSNPDSHAFIPATDSLFPLINTMVGIFTEAGNPVIFTRHFNAADENPMNLWWKDRIKKGTTEFEISGKLDCRKEDKNVYILDKQYYDAFRNSDLNGIFKNHHIKKIIICGVMTHLCCETTARSGFMKGYEIYFPIDGTADYNGEFHSASSFNLYHGFAYFLSLNGFMENRKRGEK